MAIKLRSLLGATFSAVALACGTASAQQNVNFWYHVDNAENTKLMDELVKTFEGKNPNIKIKAENVPWNNYFDKLFISIAGGKAPDVAVTRLALQPQLLEMDAIEPITKSGRQRLLTVTPHTTHRAGPQWAVQQVGSLDEVFLFFPV
jgi:multiple sugar transport system substrate-binding protein